ncbi:MAG: DUF3343 domain-containing protein [Bacillota bacterium]|jgi:hypothetical protein
MRILVTFRSTHAALEAESALMIAGLKPEILPVPRELSTSCGLCIGLEMPDHQRIAALLGEWQIDYGAIYAVEHTDNQRHYQVIFENSAPNEG